MLRDTQRRVGISIQYSTEDFKLLSLAAETASEWRLVPHQDDYNPC